MKNIIILFSVGAGFVIVLHFVLMFSDWIGTQDRKGKGGIEGASDIEDQLASLRMKYSETFTRELITADQHYLLTVDYLTSYLKLPIGDALRLHELESKNFKKGMAKLPVGNHDLGTN